MDEYFFLLEKNRRLNLPVIGLKKPFEQDLRKATDEQQDYKTQEFNTDYQNKENDYNDENFSQNDDNNRRNQTEYIKYNYKNIMKRANR